MLRPLLLSALLIACAPARANIFLVNSPADSGPGSLRTAVAALPITGDHFVIFNLPPNTTINLQSALPAFRTPSVYFDGSGAPGLTVRAANATRIFDIGLPGALTTVTLAQFRVADGFAGSDGGGCFHDPPRTFLSTLRFDRMVFENCSTTAPDANGGAIKSSGILTVVDSTFIGNRATASTAQGSARGGAIYSVRSATITGSRFVGNESLAMDPAGYASGAAVTIGIGEANITRSSFVGNRVAGNAASLLGAVECRGGSSCSIARSSFRENAGGGVYSDNPGTAIANTTFVDNSGAPALRLLLRTGSTRIDNVTFLKRGGFAPANPEHLWMQVLGGESPQVAVANTLFGATGGTNPACGIAANTTVVGGGWNLAVDTSCDLVGFATSSVFPGDLGQLDAVASVGSAPAEVSPLAPGSPAIDLASPGTPGVDPGACLAADASGTTRPQDGDSDGVPGCDVGAYEVASPRIFGNGFE